ncbi:MAG: Hsp20/alpha crystallin family protein [Tannerellaceae bacterium]|jgi:HSP20 family protein|nr:Hsp20/alpha crystallin family protein [Tannerellaceae bacterium]MDR1623560.1 Hsp20/alpha crystallin family protein [Tannerellaceae bacterium]
MNSIVRRGQNWAPDVFNDLFNTDWMFRTNATAPAINISESKEMYKIEVAAAGMTKDDFSIHFDEDNNLVISMEKKLENVKENKETRYLRREFSYSKFEQRMILPNDADKDRIQAKVEHGVLNLSIPKLDENRLKANMKTIEVE